jgi:hypothetical protein
MRQDYGMKIQNSTGQLTEQTVRNCLELIGLEAEKPKKDLGVDLEVWHPSNPEKRVYIQIKGRGKIQKNKRYRWFQIRTTKKQREESVKAGLPISEAWQKKVDLCHFFVLVSAQYGEHWVFPSSIIYEIINFNKVKYGNREDNITGKQVEMDLDIEYNGKKLTEIYGSYKNNFTLISEMLKRV